MPLVTRARRVTNVRATISGELSQGAESVIEVKCFIPYWSARANQFGETCVGTGDTREEALAAARRRCQEFETWKRERGL